MLNEQAIFEDRDLIEAILVSDDHRTLDRLAARQELGLRDRVAAAALSAPLTAAHLLGFQARGPLEGLHLVRGIAALVGGCRAARAATTATTARGFFLVAALGFAGGCIGLLSAVLGHCRGLVCLLGAAATAGLGFRGGLLGIRARRAVLGGGRGLVNRFLGTTATLGGRLLLRGTGLVVGGAAAALQLRLRFLKGGRRGHLGRGLEDGCLEK